MVRRGSIRGGTRTYTADSCYSAPDLGHCVSDHTFTNWGRPGRAFPRDWPLLRAMLRVLSDPRLDQRCSASEALYFCHLTGLPFSELEALAQLYPLEEFAQALLPYLPTSLAEHMAGRAQMLSV
jgi:hypothetical protein